MHDAKTVAAHCRILHLQEGNVAGVVLTDRPEVQKLLAALQLVGPNANLVRTRAHSFFMLFLLGNLTLSSFGATDE